MRWVRLVLAVMLIVGWTSVAAAECAWVLWVYNSVKVVWTVNSATPSYDQCERQKNKLARLAISVLLEKFYCLPDTIDPREKKE